MWIFLSQLWHLRVWVFVLCISRMCLLYAHRGYMYIHIIYGYMHKAEL